MENKKRGFLLLLTVLFLGVLITAESLAVEKILKRNEAIAQEKAFQEYRNTGQIDGSLDPLILNEIKGSPVPKDYVSFVNYSDSWNEARSFGGDRHHEGTDILSDTVSKKRGEIPVLSMSDGVVEQIGWLKLGGYRIGIRSPKGVYFYYAHLYSYAPGIKQGLKIQAGDVIGYMGDSGYGKKEGTVGKFPVHLHLGLYRNDSKHGEYSVNPYRFLQKVLRKPS
ncbi:M23 family metallopeptidase [Anaerostipes sp.]|uniref:M23 family metallopeptidase n=1 Tax=Anaerostipes sp. TaxID=1872530 RepID=UPI0025BCE187|nr:M23 family metallopeptidase [Anaerostipes sp.]MBS7009757.1 M23 family metallopeptidase [Anaerostipes sp.]